MVDASEGYKRRAGLSNIYHSKKAAFADDCVEMRIYTGCRGATDVARPRWGNQGSLQWRSQGSATLALGSASADPLGLQDAKPQRGRS